MNKASGQTSFAGDLQRLLDLEPREKQQEDKTLAEGPMGDLWLVAMSSGPRDLEVYAYRFRRVPETKNKETGAITEAGVSLGRCAWVARIREDRWISEIGEPNERTMSSAMKWIKKEVKR